MTTPSTDGPTLRACPPRETFEKVGPYLSQLGITRIGRQTGLDRFGIPVWCAYAPNAKAIVVSQGKGVNDDDARISAVMEAVERAIAGEPCCDHFMSSQARLQDEGAAFHPLAGLIARGAKPLDAAEQVLWTKARHLITQETVSVPFEAVGLDRTDLKPRFWQSSDGLASGNTKAEASLHGLLERIERDALVLWEVTPLTDRYSKRIDIANSGSAALKDIAARIDGAGFDIALFDMTTDIDVACVVALLGPKDRTSATAIRHVDVTLGAGASTSPITAALRAATEAVQSRMTFVTGARDDVPETFYQQAADRSVLDAFDAPLSTTLDRLPSSGVKDTEAALAAVLEKLQRADICDVFAVDLTPAWLPVNVVKILVPQLENADGERRQYYGARALSKMLS